MFSFILKYIGMPLAVAVIMYVIVHLQFLILHKLLRVDLSHKTRTSIGIIGFIFFFLAAFLLVCFNEYLKSKAS